MKLCLWLLAPLLCAQSFEVASIKPHPGEITFSADPAIRGTHVVATASTLLDLITSAYGIRNNQVDNAPAWGTQEHFDLDALAPADVPLTRDLANAMMRRLLADRFQLQVRWESREAAIYSLVIDKDGDKDGPKLQSSAPDARPGGFTRGSQQGLHREVTKGTMAELASQLSVTAGRPVADKTGLTGFYAYTLDWFPANRLPPAGSDVPSMFDAVREQLGLRLIPDTGIEQFLVIEQVEHPSPN